MREGWREGRNPSFGREGESERGRGPSEERGRAGGREGDGISPRILKENVEQISTPLAHVFNMSLQKGIVPLEWKEANVIPLFEKGSRNKSVNYRPVSLTSVICKLLETIIRDHMMDFLIKHKLINPSQHGFLKARSCLTNLLCFLEDN